MARFPLARQGAAALIMTLAGAAMAQLPVDSPLQRSTAFGPVLGSSDAASGTWSWKGVPFAKPPVGELRWRAPVDPHAWTAPHPAQAFGAACASSGRLYGPGRNNRYDATIGESLDQTVGSEDCLYLNIWRPATTTQKLPVIVFVHGGSNITGYTADPVYDGATLARTAGAIVVTVNYRLGVLGFFASPQLRSGDPAEDSGNFALLDVIKALQFVQRNIASFGGDAGRVTLMGESAGAVNVYALLTSPLVARTRPALFHRAVTMSGGISRPEDLPPGRFPVLVAPSLFEAQARLLLAHRLVADGLTQDLATADGYIARHKPAELAAYLRGLKLDDVLATVLGPLKAASLGGSNPIADGHVVAKSPIDAIKSGNYLKVPVLAGNTRDEGKLFPQLLALSPGLGGVSGRLLTDRQTFDIAAHYDPDAAPQTRVEDWIPKAYLPVDAPGSGFDARMGVLNDYWFVPLRDNVLVALRARQDGVWYYRFDWAREPAPFDQIFGAAHAFDLAFMFGNFGPSLWSRVMFSRGNEPGRLALSEAMMKSLGAFAHHGDPNHAALGTAWPQWPKTLRFDATLKERVITVQ